MSSIHERESYFKELHASAQTLISTFDKLDITDTDRPTPTRLHSFQHLQRPISPVTPDLVPELIAIGIESSLASELAREFSALILPLYESAAASLSSAYIRILSPGSYTEARDHKKLMESLASTMQRTYELRVEEVKNTAVDDARKRFANLQSDLQHGGDGLPDDDSDVGNAGANELDSDSEEAVNIERYYPVLEEMFRKGVVKPSRDEKLKLSEHTGIPYYNLGIWFQNRRDRGPHAGKGEWMRKYAESRSITPASHVSTADGAETEGSMSDHGMSEFDEDEWETDPEDVPDLNLLELGPSALPLPAVPALHSASPSSPQSYPMPNTSEFYSPPSTPFASSSRSISFESSSDSFSHNDASFVSAGSSIHTRSPSPLLEPGALLPSESQIYEASLTFGQLPTPTPSMSFPSSISSSFSFSAPLVHFGGAPRTRSNTPSTAPSTPDEGPSTPPTSLGFDFGPTVPFGNSSRLNIPHPDLGLSLSVNDASPSQGVRQTPPMTLRSFNFEFSLTPSPTRGKFNDVDLSFGSFDIAPYSSATSFFDSFNANLDTPSSSNSASDYATPDPQRSDSPSRTPSPLPPQSILLDFAGVNENNWRHPTPEPSEVGSQEDAVESKLLAAAASVASRNTGHQPHNLSPFKLAFHHPISPRPASPLMEPLFPLSSPLRDPSPIPSPTSPVMGMLPFLNHALRPPARVDELAAYANIRVEKPSLPVPLAAERGGLDEPSPLALTRHLELEPEPTIQLSLFDVLKEPPVPVVDKATRDRVDDFFKRYCNGSSDETQAKPPCFPLTSYLPSASTSTVPQDVEAI